MQKSHIWSTQNATSFAGCASRLSHSCVACRLLQEIATLKTAAFVGGHEGPQHDLSSLLDVLVGCISALHGQRHAGLISEVFSISLWDAIKVGPSMCRMHAEFYLLQSYISETIPTWHSVVSNGHKWIANIHHRGKSISAGQHMQSLNQVLCRSYDLQCCASCFTWQW